MAKKAAATEADTNKDGYTIGTFNVIRRDHVGDKGKVCGAGLTEERANAYKANRELEGEACAYDVVEVV